MTKLEEQDEGRYDKHVLHMGWKIRIAELQASLVAVAYNLASHDP